MEQNEVANSVGRRRSDEAGNAPRFGVPGCDAAPPPRPSGTFLRPYSRGARGSLAAVWSCAPTTHLAACYPVCCHPRPSPGPPGHPPKIEKERKLFPSSVAARKSSPPVSGRAGFLELETKSKPARESGPHHPRRSPAFVCAISLIQQNTCSAVATLQAAGELWGAPGPAPGCPQARTAGRDAGGQGGRVPTAPFLYPLPLWTLPAARRAAPAGPTLLAPFQLAVQGSLERGSHAPGQGGNGLQMGGQPHRGHGLPRDHPPGLEPGSACPLGTLVSPCPLIPANRRWGGLGCWPRWVSTHQEHTYHSAPRSSCYAGC